jgi:hypothetical protein
VTREILPELWALVTNKMDATEFFFARFEHRINFPLQRDLHFLPLQCINPTVNRVG